MSLEILLLAAEYVDRRETEHGYACREPPKRPLPVQSRTTRRYRQRRVFKLSTSFSGKSSSCRTNHNELEKNRRAELRGCIDKLKGVVPLDSGYHRHTTHRLLINARKLIKSLESGLRAGMEERDRQLGVQRRLRRRYHQLTVMSFQTTATSSSSRRTGSRCSTSSTESTESSGIGDSVSYPSSDESEMIDVECASDCATDFDSGCDDGHLS